MNCLIRLKGYEATINKERDCSSEEEHKFFFNENDLKISHRSLLGLLKRSGLRRRKYGTKHVGNDINAIGTNA